ncbi:MAG: ABC transporter permease [Lachnospiraceae bacterium]|nr:ABC transporter permease [Lachnospiraceae bacterium]
MQVFKAFLRVLKSKFGASIIYIVLFFLVGAFMSHSDKAENVWEKTQMAMVVRDLDNTEESRLLTDFILKGNKRVHEFDNEDDLTDAMYYGRVDCELTIPAGYAERLKSGDVEDLITHRHIHESYAVANIRMLVEKYISSVEAYLALGRDTLEASKEASEALADEVEVTIVTEDEAKDAAKEHILSFFRYMPYIFLCVILNSLCPALIAMNKKDIRYRTDCSGIRPHSYTLQLFGASVVYVGAIWILFALAGVLLSGTMYSGRLWIVVANSFVFALFAAVLALFVSEFSPGDTVVSLFTQLVSLGMCFLCGVFVDQGLLGSGVAAVGRFLPAYWYVRIIRMLSGALPYDAGEVALALGIEAGFVAVFVLLAILVRRSRVTSAVVRRAMA